jgi:predicted nucleic acid-binding protein
MKKIFLDANIIIDLVNSGNSRHTESLFLFSELTKKKAKLYVSPTSFAITYYFLGKVIKDSVKLNKVITKLFSNFIFTREDDVIMDKVMKSSFDDLEDALQYFSALDGGAGVIISYNQHDFINTSIPVYHPVQYIAEFLL